MKASSGSLILGLAALLLPGLTVSAVFLNARPNRLQFLTEESVSLSCEGQQSSAGWTVRRTAGGGKAQRCGDGPQDFGSFDGSSCIISDLSSLSDSGVYWCENNDGHKTPELNITVSDVILEIPLLPVMGGSDVTLRCRTRDGSIDIAYFFRNRVRIGSGPKGEFTISKVKQSDDGVYFCSTDLSGHSSQSRLIVRDLSPTDRPLTTPSHHSTLSPDTYLPSTPPPSSPLSSLLLPVVAALVSLSVLVSILAGVLLLCKRQAGLAVQLLSGLAVSAGLAVLLLAGLTVSAGAFPPPTVSMVRLLCHLVVFCPYCMLTILMLSIYCSKKTGNKQPVSRETADRVEGEDYGNVTTEHDF
ncbi:uncharacterized protein LOC108902376 [Lates calcarifer]|uniref:Uncharacterized protein LOC108902376 n=1 Tax=Lates calcarifer TaxID=8187 RepID=A0AAJ7QM33_LATCA|nr:uncharacterized protein LOC108902376 [Lates calcarifer]